VTISEDEGAWLYAETIRKVHELNPGTGVEMLAPDFSGKSDLLNQVFEFATRSLRS
jgi:lipoic acid synthetase